jgi:hypothetical protein
VLAGIAVLALLAVNESSIIKIFSAYATHVGLFHGYAPEENGRFRSLITLLPFGGWLLVFIGGRRLIRARRTALLLYIAAAIIPFAVAYLPVLTTPRYLLVPMVILALPLCEGLAALLEKGACCGIGPIAAALLLASYLVGFDRHGAPHFRAGYHLVTHDGPRVAGGMAFLPAVIRDERALNEHCLRARWGHLLYRLVTMASRHEHEQCVVFHPKEWLGKTELEHELFRHAFKPEPASGAWQREAHPGRKGSLAFRRLILTPRADKKCAFW